VVLATTGCATGITRQAEDVTGTTARVTGLVISNAGGTVEYWVEYGPTTAYGSESTHQTTDAGVNEPVSAVVDLSGLSRATAYHYRLCASDSQQSGGPGCGQDRTFITPNLECGDVITQDFRLSRSVSCQDDSFTVDGIVIGADGVDVNLAGHHLGGPGASLIDATQPAGIDNTGGYDNVTIRNGGLSGWGMAIELEGASANTIRGVDAGGTIGVEIRGGSGNAIRYSSVTGRPGLVAQDTVGLVVADSSGGQWRVTGNDARIVRNALGQGDIGFPPNPDVPCLSVFGNGNLIQLNRVSGCFSVGILLRAGGDNSLIENTITGPPSNGFGDGIRIEPFTSGTLLRENQSRNNADDGIDVRSSGASLLDNLVESNGDFGIDAVPGVIDLGGNVARSNGNPAACRNVACLD
jgi:parallel beta-helix repeat protein